MGMPVVVGVSAAAASGIGDITPAFPTGYTAVDNDILLTTIECENTDTITVPAGWATVTSQVVATGTPTKLTLIWKRAVAGDTAPTIVDTGGTNNHQIGRMLVVSGCKTTGNPWNTLAGTTETTADTTVSIPGLTTTAINCLVVAVFSTGRDSTTVNATAGANASLANFTEQMDNWTNAGLGGGFALFTGEKATAGVVSATTATVSTADFKALIAVALEGASEPDANRWNKGIPVGMRWNRAASIAANY